MKHRTPKCGVTAVLSLGRWLPIAARVQERCVWCDLRAVPSVPTRSRRAGSFPALRGSRGCARRAVRVAGCAGALFDKLRAGDAPFVGVPASAGTTVGARGLRRPLASAPALGSRPRIGVRGKLLGNDGGRGGALRLAQGERGLAPLRLSGFLPPQERRLGRGARGPRGRADARLAPRPWSGTCPDECRVQSAASRQSCRDDVLSAIQGG